MIVYRTQTDLAPHLEELRKNGNSIGLVPTMGALHAGHLSLVERSTGENDATVVTIFVNPTQFNDPEDLEKYPRNPGKDLKLLQSNRADVVFIPAIKEMYPDADHRTFDLGGLDLVGEIDMTGGNLLDAGDLKLPGLQYPADFGIGHAATLLHPGRRCQRGFSSCRPFASSRWLCRFRD